MRPLSALPAAGPLFTTLLLLLTALPVRASESNGLRIEVTKAVECSRKTQVSDSIRVHYKGTLEDGTLFDASYGRGEPFSFTLGKGEVIKGWDEGLLDMCVGEGRKLIIPPEMAYGNRRVGIIPSGSTLVFDTELVGIKGVPAEPAPPTPPAPPALPTPPTPSTVPSLNKDTGGAASSTVIGSVPAETTTPAAVGSPGGPKDHAKEEDSECRLLGPFALLVQGALGALALLSLVWKRYRETPRRPVKIWWFDVSKQVFGSVLLHLANLFMSMLSSGDLDVAAKAKEAAATAFVQDDGGRRPNPCSFYLLNLAIDTTIGIPILVVLLRLLHHAFLFTPLAKPPESIRSGNYGHPPRATWWLKQSVIYFLGLFGMKLCVFFIFQILPWIAWVGDWALRWTEGNEALQIIFVMLIFPLIMNALQYYIIDSFIKDPVGGGEHQPVPTEDVEDDEEGSEDEEDSEAEEERREERKKVGATMSTRELAKEANPTPVPVGSGEYDPETDGAGSSSSSSPRRDEATK